MLKRSLQLQVQATIPEDPFFIMSRDWKKIACIFSVKITDVKFDAGDPRDAEIIVKILCDKGMTDPFEDEPMEVSSARKRE